MWFHKFKKALHSELHQFTQYLIKHPTHRIFAKTIYSKKGQYENPKIVTIQLKQQVFDYSNSNNRGLDVRIIKKNYFLKLLKFLVISL
jgi:hypothetical protein